MLYILKNINDESIIYLNKQEKLIVGRKDCDIIIQNDSSISRKHASINIKNNKVSVIDLGSKYKTFYKGKELEPNVEIHLKINDEIQFGVMTSLYRLEHHVYVTTTTRLNDTDKAKLNKNLAAIGGKYLETWTTECTHLTSKEMNLTVKVLHALLDQKFIVTPAFWSKVAENVSQNLPLPNEQDFNNLEVAEPLLHKADLGINPTRKKIFNGKIFLFLKEKNKKQMEEIIHKAGGNVKSWEQNSIPINDIIHSPKEFLIIQVPYQEENESFSELIRRYSELNKRPIPLSEIAIAILMCDTKRFCNPLFKLTEEVFSTKPTRLPTQNPIAQDTQSEYFSISCKREEKEFIIPDTLDNQIDLTIKLDDNEKSNNTEKPNEKDSQDTYIKDKNISERSTKRETVEESTENPFKKIKLERQEKASGKKQEQRIGYFSKSTSEKRKTEDTLENEESPKREEKNPFASMKKKIKTEAGTSKSINPFSLMKKQTENNCSISEENSFKSFKTTKEAKKTNPNNVNANSSKNEIFNIRCNYNQSLNLTREKSWELDNTWYSKNSLDNSKSVKMEKELESDIQDYIDLFKDKFVIDVLKVEVRILDKTCDVTDGIFSGRKNFKKFKKVQPLKSQTTTISTNSFIEIIPENISGIVDDRKKNYDSDEEKQTNLQNFKRSKKKFVL